MVSKDLLDILCCPETKQDIEYIDGDTIKKINEQIKKGKYISKHLKKGAVDVRSRDMTESDKTFFKKAAAGIALIVILEATPPHFHLQF